MFGWLAQVYEALSAPLLEWMNANEVSNAVVTTESARSLTGDSSINSLFSSKNIADNIYSKTIANISVSEQSVLTAAEWLSHLDPSSSAFDVSDADVPVFSMPSKNGIPLSSVISAQAVEILIPAFAGMTVAAAGRHTSEDTLLPQRRLGSVSSYEALVFLPSLLLVPKYPALSAGLFVLQQMMQAHAYRLRDETMASEDITNAFKTRHVDDVKMSDVSAEFSVQDRTEQYRARRLQSNNAACNGSQIIFPEAESGWAFTLGGAGDDEGQSIAATPDGGFVVTGYTNSFGAGSYDALLIKLNATGGVVWAKIFGDASNNQGYSVVVASDGSLVLTGSSFLVRFNAMGNLQWAKTLGAYGGNSLAMTADGGMALLTSSALIRFNSTGGLQWAKSLTELTGTSLAVSLDGGIVITGNTASFGAVYQDILLAKFNSTGGLQWAKKLGSPFFIYANALMIGTDGGIWLAGQFSFVSMLAKFNATGGLQWAETFASYLDRGAGIGLVMTVDNGTIVTGATTYPRASYIGLGDILLARFNSTGTLLWIKTLGGVEDDRGLSVAIGSNGQTVITGVTSSYGNGAADIFMLGVNDIGAPPSSLGVLSLVSGDTRIQTIVGDAMLLTVSPTVTNLVPSISNWTTLYFSNTSLMLTPLTYRINTSAFGSLSNPILMYQWSYTLPSSYYLQLPAQPRLHVDASQVDWLNYDAQTQILLGTPLLSPLGMKTIRLVFEPLVVSGAGAFHFDDVVVNLCIVNEDPSFETYGTVGGDQGNNVVMTADGGKLLAGFTSSGALLMKFDVSGELTWTKELMGVGQRVIVAPDGGIILVGYTSLNYGLALFMKFTSQGTLQWAKTLSLGSIGLYSCILNDVVITPDNNIVMTGILSPLVGGSDKQFFLAKFNSTGEVAWMTTFINPLAYASDVGRRIEVTPDHGFIVTGMYGQYYRSNFENILLAKFNSTGNLLWAKSFSPQFYYSPNSNCGNSLALSSDGGIILTGYVGNFPDDGDILLAKFNSTGSLQWATTFGGTATDSGEDLMQFANGDLLLTGSTSSFGAGLSDVFIARVNASGNLLWAKTWGGVYADSATAIMATPDGFILTGSTASFGVGGADIFLATFNAQGEPLSSAISCVDITPQLVVRSPSLVSTNLLPTLNVSHAIPLVITDLTTAVSNATLSETTGFLRSTGLSPLMQVPFGQGCFLPMTDVLGLNVEVFQISATGQAFLPSWLSYNPFNQVLSGIPSGSVRGSYSITMALSLYSQQQDITFILNVTNSVPYLTASPLFNVTVGRFLISLGNMFRDNENDPIGPYAITQNNGALPPAIGSIDAASGRLFGTTLSGDQGTYTFNITASDPYNTGWQLITVNVKNTPPNQQYDFSNPDPVTVGNKLSYSFPSNAFADRDGDPVSYTASVPAFLSFNPSSQTLSGTLVAANRGIYPVYFFASDPYAGVSNVSIVVSVNGIPAQQLSLSTLTTTPVNLPYAFTLPAGLFVDPDGDTVSYALTEDIQHIKPSWLLFNSTNNRLSGTPNANMHQPIPIRFTVSDGRGGQTFFDTNLIIPNSLPVVRAGLSNQTVTINQVRSLVIPSDAFADADRDALVYALNLLSGRSQSWLSLANGVITFFPRSGDQGDYQFTLLASDGQGGQATLTLNATVPNDAPQLMYPIPAPVDARSQQLWSTTLLSNNFKDNDLDPLTYTAHVIGSASLPAWISFDPIRLFFQGKPEGVNRGITPLVITVSDGFGGIARGYMNVTVINSAPAPEGRLLDQQVSQTESSFVFTLPPFSDPDGDAVSYLAQMQNDEALLHWMQFDASTRIFTTSPAQATPGNYLINIIATDALGLNQTSTFNVAIQAPPKTAPTSLSAQLQALAPSLGSAGLVVLVATLIIWRHKRIHNTNQQVQRWSSFSRGEGVGQGNITFAMLSRDIRMIADLVAECAPMTQIETAVYEFRNSLRQYYRSPEAMHPMTVLLDAQIIEALIQFSIHHREELNANTEVVSTDNILGAAKLLHLFMRLVLSEHSGRSRKLLHETKSDYLEQLNQLIAYIPTKNVEHIEILYQLYSAREALICVADTHTLKKICEETIVHLISPGDLFSDVKKFALDFPSLWYMALLDIHLLANQAMRSMAMLLNIQEKAATYRDWRFLFGMVPVLLEVMINAEDDAIRQQALKGEDNKGKITKLGFLHLLTIKNTMFYPHRERVREQAAAKLRAVSLQLKDTERTQLGPFLAMSPSLTRGERVERVVSSRSVDGFASTNPMFAASGRGLFRPAMSRQVQSGALQPSSTETSVRSLS